MEQPDEEREDPTEAARIAALPYPEKNPPPLNIQAAALACAVAAAQKFAKENGAKVSVRCETTRDLWDYMVTGDAFMVDGNYVRPEGLEGVFLYVDPNLLPGRTTLHVVTEEYEPIDQCAGTLTAPNGAEERCLLSALPGGKFCRRHAAPTPAQASSGPAEGQEGGPVEND